MPYTKPEHLPLSVALWLTFDEYDYVDKQNYISATSLLKPTKQTILAARYRQSPLANKPDNLMQRFANRLGTAVHNSIDMAWDVHLKRGLQLLGHPDKVAENTVVFNENTGMPSDEEIAKLRAEGKNIIIKEVRMFRDFGKYIIGGKTDFVINGVPEDFKTVKTWAYGDEVKLKKELMQISIYRWLNPVAIWEDHGRIIQIFMDWMKGQKIRAGYPQEPIVAHTMELHSFAEVERFIEGKIRELEHYMDLPESELPRCTDEDLWRGKDSIKYYSDPAKAKDPKARSTKNFENLHEAEMHRQSKGKGVIKIVKGKVKACAYCAGYDMCQQKDEYLADGTLSIEDD